MSSKIIKGWNDEARMPVLARFGEKLKAQGAPLKERISTALYRLKIQKNKLETLTARIQSQDQRLFKKCVDSQLSRDRARAVMYANECAELRKMVRTALSCQLALDKVILRLETVKQFGDIAAMMTPVASVIRSIKDQISGLMPEVSFELNDICRSLDEIAVEFGEAVGVEEPTVAEGEEAEKIIREAAAVAEQTLKERFPELPQPARLMEESQ
ncbi:MAG: Snf7 family protein [Candidatus Bathyarchaeia archaeon]